MKKGSTQQTGGDSIVISHKPSMKLKTLSSVDGMDKSTCSKRLKLPKKLLDDGHTINLVSVPRKSRSSVVSKKRHPNSSSPNLIKAVISKCEMSSTDANKKLKLDPDEQHWITKNEVEAIAGLLALAAIDNTKKINLNNKISKPEDPNESTNTADVKKDCKDVTDGNSSRKRCCSHVYICQIIRNLQISKGKTVNSREQSGIKTAHEKVTTNVNAGINLNEMVSQTYYGNPFCDPSQWLRPPMFPKQQMWMNNRFMYKPPQPRSYVQASLHNVPLSKQQQQQILISGDSATTLKLALQ